MLIAAVLSLLFLAVHGLMRSTPSKGGSSMNVDFRGELGAQAPLGFWDPLGFLKDADQERFDRLRNVRSAHDRYQEEFLLTYAAAAFGFRWS
jgi:hypothetical protein